MADIPRYGLVLRAALPPRFSRRSTQKKNLVHPSELAEQACDIEINRFKEPIFSRTSTSPPYWRDYLLSVPPRWESNRLAAADFGRYPSESWKITCYGSLTGYSRAALQVLKQQDEKSRAMQ